MTDGETVKTRAIAVKVSPYGDNDKMLTMLSAERGVISVSAKGVKSLKNKNAPAAQPLCCSDLVLKKRGDIYSLVSADVLESFYSLRESVEALSYANYFASLALMCSVREARADEELSLLLNTLFVLSKNHSRADVICAAYELKMCETAGVAPLAGRCACGGEAAYFDLKSGECVCALHKTDSSKKVSPSAIRVMEYVLDSPLKDALSFDTDRATAREVSGVTQEFIRFQFGFLPKGLDYLKKLII